MSTRYVIDGRYRVEASLGAGGFGRLYHGWDTRLDRPIVLKRIPSTAAGASGDHHPPPGLYACLEHTYLLNASDRGHDGDGLWIVMDVVGGGTFQDIIAARHPSKHRGPLRTVGPNDPARGPRPASLAQTWTLPEAIALLASACDAMGSGHARGVIHLDLKPDNIMVAEDRSPRIIDWGLAVLFRDRLPAPSPGSTPPGVPTYMAPERLRGEPSAFAATADVYAFGAILFELLCGEPPFRQAPPNAICQVLGTWSPLTDDRLASAVHEVRLCRPICAQAMALDPTDRPPDGSTLAAMLHDALARADLARAHRLRESAGHSRRTATEQDALARAEYARLKLTPWAPASAGDTMRRHRGAARDARLSAQMTEARWVGEVEEVLFAMPDLIEAHTALAEHAMERLLDAERRRTDEAPRLEIRLRQLTEKLADRVHTAADALPRRVLDRCRAVLDGKASLTLHTDPAGVEVYCAHLSDATGSRVPGPFERLGSTPLQAVELPRGRLLIELRHPDCPTIRHALTTARSEHVVWAPPGATTPYAVPIPRLGDLGDGEVYVPPAWAWLGLDRGAIDPVTPRRVWVDGFIAKANPTTSGQYIRFLEDLIAHGHADRARAALPILPDWGNERRRVPLFDIVDGRVCAKAAHPDPDMPIRMIDWPSARAFAAWAAQHTGQPWRLPSEFELEAATRGGDRRALPWGDTFIPSLTRVSNSRNATPSPAPVGEETGDVSVHGLRWLVGNTRAWCLEGWSMDGPADGDRLRIEQAVEVGDAAFRMIRGGAWTAPSDTVRAGSRLAGRVETHPTTVSVRLVRSWPTPDHPGTAT